MSNIFIIAEAGVNHQGSLDMALRLVDSAVAAGADAIKFQTFRAKSLTTSKAEMAQYQVENTGHVRTQLEMLSELELSLEEHFIIAEYCRNVGIVFMSSPFDVESVDALASLGLDTFKIPSGEITNLPYLEKIGSLRKRVIMSTGMATLDEVGLALHVLRQTGTEDVAVLHCNTSYPTPLEDVNLAAIHTLREVFNVQVGYSDHTMGIEIPVAAAALGASIIEKHLTLDRNLNGPDHKASLEPEEFRRMVISIRNVERAIGDGVKRPTKSELPNIGVVRKSIVAARRIEKGEVFSCENLAVKRPGNGISPMKWYEVIGRKAPRDFERDELIEL